MYRELFLALAVSIDTYLTAAAYQSGEIKISALSKAVISLIGAAVLGVSLFLSELLGERLPDSLCETAGFVILIVIGMVTIFKSIIRSLIRRISGSSSGRISLSGFGLVVSIYLDDTAADVDKSKSLSVSEAAALAAAGSLDSAATGLSCGFTGVSPLYAFVFAFAAGLIALTAGAFTGKKISSLRRDFSWVGGAVLIIFAVFSRLF